MCQFTTFVVATWSRVDDEGVNGQRLPIVAYDDPVYLVVAVAGAKVADRGVGCLRRNAHAHGGEGLEEMTEQGAGLGADRCAFHAAPIQRAGPESDSRST